ncbi:MAG: hypothetical protein CMF50_02620 [Legionellales bacterium]|nr:hypothetical protein [Legionellales bacterium]|tara:strand:+ start:8996 stop:9472 length:477 start_codon:yes stop_codon:yes gene_type:complete
MQQTFKLISYIGLLVLSTACLAYPKDWEYSHLGVPTKEHSKNELYDSKWKYYTWGYDESEFNIQMHRFDDDAPFPELIKTKAHLAFKVPNLKDAIKNRDVIWGPIESKPGLFVAMIKDPATGMPIELLQTPLSKEEMIEKYHVPLHNQSHNYKRNIPT